MMKATVTTSSQSVTTLLAGKTPYSDAFKDGSTCAITIANEHATDAIYVEFYGAASTTTSMPLKAGKKFVVEGVRPSDIYLIAGSSIADVFFLF